MKAEVIKTEFEKAEKQAQRDMCDCTHSITTRCTIMVDDIKRCLGCGFYEKRN